MCSPFNPASLSVQPRERWDRYLETLAGTELVARAYSYPSSDSFVDDRLSQQDPQKIRREEQLLRSVLDFDWAIAVDFGAGEGARLGCFDSPRRSAALLVACEPDVVRAAKARRRAKSCRFVTVCVVAGTFDRLDVGEVYSTVDLIVCNQVLGHISPEETAEVLSAFGRLLRPGGKLVVSIPVFSQELSLHPATGWQGDGDYYHVVNLSGDPFGFGYRRSVSRDTFARLAAHSDPGLLPVRAFELPLITLGQLDDYPRRITIVPKTITRVLPPVLLPTTEAWLYSLHAMQPNAATSPIGDAMFIFERSDKP